MPAVLPLASAFSLLPPVILPLLLPLSCLLPVLWPLPSLCFFPIDSAFSVAFVMPAACPMVPAFSLLFLVILPLLLPLPCLMPSCCCASYTGFAAAFSFCPLFSSAFVALPLPTLPLLEAFSPCKAVGLGADISSKPVTLPSTSSSALCEAIGYCRLLPLISACMMEYLSFHEVGVLQALPSSGLLCEAALSSLSLQLPALECL
eukprot:293199-Pelagomonas_calceolata.AAC.2